jgi:hypothetical protein
MATYKTISVGSDGRRNFHNMTDLTLRVTANQYIRRRDIVDAVALTESQANRIGRHFCGISDCCCGSKPAGMEEVQEGEWIIHLSREQAEYLTGREIDRDEWDERLYL